MEDEVSTAETGQGDAVNSEGEPSADMSNNSPTKRGRGRPQGSKKLKVCVTDIKLLEFVSDISNGGSPQTPRGRGRPKVHKPTEQQESVGDNADNSSPCKVSPTGTTKQASDEDVSPKKRGRPRKSTPKMADGSEDLPNGDSEKPKERRGRPKGSTKRKSEATDGSVTPKKRGRPKGSPNKKPRLMNELSGDVSIISAKRGRGRARKSESNGISETPQRGRGRPRKSDVSVDKSAKRGRGRPRGSQNMKPTAYRASGKVGRPPKGASPSTKEKRGRPRKSPANRGRGRPRKNPLLSPDELKKPRVWKPLGRPRKYPLADPPKESSAAPPRGRGRPRKSETKRGAHLRKNSPSTPRTPTYDGPPRKRGRPPGPAKSKVKSPAKRGRGRPKGSVKKDEAENASPNQSTAMSDSAVEEELYEDAVETVEMPGDQGEEVEETLIHQDETFDISNQA